MRGCDGVRVAEPGTQLRRERPWPSEGEVSRAGPVAASCATRRATGTSGLSTEGTEAGPPALALSPPCVPNS